MEDECGEITRLKIPEIFTSHWKKIGLDAERDGKPLEGFEQKNNMVWLHLKTHSSSCGLRRNHKQGWGREVRGRVCIWGVKPGWAGRGHCNNPVGRWRVGLVTKLMPGIDWLNLIGPIYISNWLNRGDGERWQVKLLYIYCNYVYFLIIISYIWINLDECFLYIP